MSLSQNFPPNLPRGLRRRLIEIGNAKDGNIDLSDAALILAASERPGVKLLPYQRHLESLADEVRIYAGETEPEGIEIGGAGLDLRIEALVQVIARRYGYGGSEALFDDPDAANLMRVIDNRSGMPETLGIIYISTARALGWDVCGLDFPGHFLIRLEADGERRIIDPFGGGVTVEAADMRGMFKAVAGNHVELTPDHYRAISNRGVLLRLQNIIKSTALQGKKWGEALQVMERTLLFAPDETELWLEAGQLHAKLDHVEDAVRVLEEYVNRTSGEDRRYNASVLLQELKTRLN